MKIRKGFISLALSRAKRLDFSWLFRHARKYLAIKKSIRRDDGTTDAGPIIAHFFCTAECNLRCGMCPIPLRHAGHELGTEEAFALIDGLADLGVSGISFTGGEPLLRPDIFKLIARTKQHGMEALLVTNGLELDRFKAEITAAAPDSVMVSIDGADAAAHDNNRGRAGSFQKTQKGIEALKAYMKEKGKAITLAASVVISKDNIHQLGDIVTLCREIGMARVVLCPLHVFENGRSFIPGIPVSFNVSDSLRNHPLRRLIDNSEAYLEKLSGILKDEAPPAGCRAGYTTLIIGPNGKAYPCKAYFETERSLGDCQAVNMDMKQLWHSASFNEFRKRCGTCRECFLTINREFDTLFK